MKITVAEAKAKMAVLAAAVRVSRAEVKRLTKIEDRINPGKPLLFGQVHRDKPWSPALLKAIEDTNALVDTFNKLSSRVHKAEQAAITRKATAATTAQTRAGMCKGCFQVSSANGVCGCP